MTTFIGRREFITLLGRAAVVWPVLAAAADPPITQRAEAAAANLPHIETVRVKPLEPAAASYQFRLGDGNVDLMKAFSLSSERGIGASWQAPAHIRLLETPSTSASGSGKGLRPEGRPPELPSKDRFRKPSNGQGNRPIIPITRTSVTGS